VLEHPFESNVQVGYLDVAAIAVTKDDVLIAPALTDVLPSGLLLFLVPL